MIDMDTLRENFGARRGRAEPLLGDAALLYLLLEKYDCPD